MHKIRISHCDLQVSSLPRKYWTRLKVANDLRTLDYYSVVLFTTVKMLQAVDFRLLTAVINTKVLETMLATFTLNFRASLEPTQVELPFVLCSKSMLQAKPK
jgi:hypothetical protein